MILLYLINGKKQFREIKFFWNCPFKDILSKLIESYCPFPSIIVTAD